MIPLIAIWNVLSLPPVIDPIGWGSFQGRDFDNHGHIAKYVISTVHLRATLPVRPSGSGS
jgi:hypothetical protein